jgi:hypothetical protein
LSDCDEQAVTVAVLVYASRLMNVQNGLCWIMLDYVGLCWLLRVCVCLCLKSALVGNTLDDV